MRAYTAVRTTDQPAGAPAPAGSLNRWLQLVFWMLLLLSFIFVVAPAMKEKIPAIATLANYVSQSGIDAGALYYSEVEEVGEADLAIRNTFRFYLEED